MAIDRDLGVVVLSALARAGRHLSSGWEMTAATGVRGLRLLSETDQFDALLFTETHPAALAVLQRNVGRFEHRGARALAHDARQSIERASFDFVDLDPYGSPIPFLDSALASLRTPGVLAVTATDMRVLGGADPAAAERRYGGRPVRGRLGPESGLRLLLACIARRLAEQGRTIVPLLAYVHDHHVRLYTRVESVVGPSETPVREIRSDQWEGPPLGEGGPFGPLWVGPLFDPGLVASLELPRSAAHPDELARMLDRFHAEAPADRPFFYESNTIAQSCGLTAPPPVDRMLEALRAAGWAAGRTHARAGAFRTTAPRGAVESIAQAMASQSQNDRVRA
jgi:tRNA (guanine26-N2/guanine27-N2)-dimethyltransferase